MPLDLTCSDPNPLLPGIYQTDTFHRQPLFCIDGKVVSSWHEAFALHGPAKLDDINPAYIACLISLTQDAHVSPYKRIKRCPRSSYIQINNNSKLNFTPYDPFGCGPQQMAAEEVHDFLRLGLLENLRNALENTISPIACEHSSGLDSNSILGALRNGLKIPSERIYTYSDETGGERELLLKFRDFYQLNPENCLVGTHESVNDIPFAIDSVKANIRILGAPPLTRGIGTSSLRDLSKNGCKMFFSGFGGDQALSHNASNVATDLVVQRRWGDLIKWCGGRRSALKTALSRLAVINSQSIANARLKKRVMQARRSDLLARHLTKDGSNLLKPLIHERQTWEINRFIPQAVSIRKRVLADWVTVRAEEETRLALSFGMVKKFPLLDVRSIATILNQDPAIFGENIYKGRLLSRRAFAPYLEKFLHDNPTKNRTPEEGWDSWDETRLLENRKILFSALNDFNKDWHGKMKYYWNLPGIQKEIESIYTSQTSSLNKVFESLIAIHKLIAINEWLKSLDS